MKHKCVSVEVTTDRWPMAGGRQEHVEHQGLSTDGRLDSGIFGTLSAQRVFNADIAAIMVRILSCANISASV